MGLQVVGRLVNEHTTVGFILSNRPNEKELNLQIEKCAV